MIPPVSQHIHLHFTKARYQEAPHSSPVIILMSALFDPINRLVWGFLLFKFVFLYFITHGSLIFIFMQSFLAHKLN